MKIYIGTLIHRVTDNNNPEIIVIPATGIKIGEKFIENLKIAIGEIPLSKDYSDDDKFFADYHAMLSRITEFIQSRMPRSERVL